MEMNQRRIFIGDVHGFYEPLIRLLEAIAPTEQDEVYFVGDLIDRGPDSAQVVDFVMNSGYQCLLGNHEEMLLEVINNNLPEEILQSWLYSGGYSTVASYNNNIPQNHLDWMANLPLYLDLGDIWLVHAGIHPYIPIGEQTSQQFCWVRDEFHSISEPYFPDKLIITGHTMTFTLPGVKPGQIASGPGWLDIDTGVYHRQSGWLTGIDLTNGKAYQANSIFKHIRVIPLEDIIVEIQPSLVLAQRLQKL
jgi:serine/threonine protein phosphatase 1